VASRDTGGRERAGRGFGALARKAIHDAAFAAAREHEFHDGSRRAHAIARAQSANIDGPPPPVAPAVITRRADGQATVRAIRLTEPLKVDGVLDEEVYTREQPFGGLIQVTPDFGRPQSERSDVWVTYDDTHIYLTCRCWDSAPPDEWVVNELRRDTGGLRNNDHIGVMFDTFYDRRSGFAFYTNPLGARADYSIVDEGNSNSDWNPVWTSKTGRFEGGWTVEMAIPLKSLRYQAGMNQSWGIQLRRSVRRRNEWGYLTPVPQGLAGPQALNRVSAAGTLVGLDLPVSGRNVEVKPYVVSRLTSDRVQVPATSNEFGGDVGGDLKIGITPSLTADFTMNTDFAQVEVDEQQVNLTRFRTSRWPRAVRAPRPLRSPAAPGRSPVARDPQRAAADRHARTLRPRRSFPGASALA
jgi:hypothetical protein